MAPPNNPATARVVLRTTRDTRKFLNVVHMTRADGAELTSADLLDMANAVADWWQNSYRHICKSVMVGLDVVATKQDPNDPLQETVYINGPGDYVPGAPLPGNDAAALSWRTGLAGRKYRGRTYHMGPSSGSVNANDTLTGQFLTDWSTAGQYLLSHLITAGLRLIIFHRSTNTFTTVIGMIVDQLIDSQRRRLAERGA